MVPLSALPLAWPYVTIVRMNTSGEGRSLKNRSSNRDVKIQKRKTRISYKTGSRKQVFYPPFRSSRPLFSVFSSQTAPNRLIFIPFNRPVYLETGSVRLFWLCCFSITLSHTLQEHWKAASKRQRITAVPAPVTALELNTTGMYYCSWICSNGSGVGLPC